MVFKIAHCLPNVNSSTVLLSFTSSIIPSPADTLDKDSVCAVYDCSDGDFDTRT